MPGDVLVPAAGAPALGPLPPPAVAIPKGVLGLTGPPNQELDALSFGVDRLFDPHEMDPLVSPFGLHFSVDDFAIGVGGLQPDVASEAPSADACADVFASPITAFSVLTPPGLPFGINTGVIDGNGLISGSGSVYPGVGLVEPGIPGVQDDLDALDIESGSATNDGGYPGSGVFFSLDTSYVDPITGAPHAATALGEGVVSGDILYSPAPGVSFVWAPANVLGLDLVSGPDSDDLDALIIAENGDGMFWCGEGPFGWLSGADMVLFSVRRGSAVIGKPDSLFGAPICEGDILMPPVFGASPYPAIFIAAEKLGLATVRTNNTDNDDSNDVLHSDDLDAADYAWMGPELITSEYCFCDSSAPAPCGNYYATGGCANSTGVGAKLQASGSSNVLGSLTMTVSQMPTGKHGLLFIGPNSAMLPFVDGLRCVVGSVTRLSVANSGSTGGMSFNGVVGLASAKGLTINPGDTWNLQTWYRDTPNVSSPCGSGSNLTNAVSALFW